MARSTEPKYKIGDKVWKMAYNKPTEITLTGVVKVGDYTRQTPFNYTTSLETSDRMNWEHEDWLYPSKEELLATL